MIPRGDLIVPPDLTTMLIEMLKEMKEEQKEIRNEIAIIRSKQEDAAVSITVIETMQKAIENLKIEERLKQVEVIIGQSRGGVNLFVWLVPTTIAVIGLIISTLPYLHK